MLGLYIDTSTCEYRISGDAAIRQRSLSNCGKSVDTTSKIQ